MTALNQSPGDSLPKSRNILWVVDFEYSTRLHHGAIMRYVNYSKELLRRGHSVFAVVLFEPGLHKESRAWFEELKADRIITDFIELDYDPPRQQRRLAALAIYPGLSDLVLRAYRLRAARVVEEAMGRWKVDALILSNRRLLFLAQMVRGPQPRLLDFCDCLSLYLYRDFKECLKNRHHLGASALLRPIVEASLEERYYGRRSQSNLLVSPVDKQAMDRITGAPHRNLVLLNGVDLSPRKDLVAKDPTRLIFTGNMNFGPNYAAANWFLNHVFGRVLEQAPDTHLIIAGANPPAALRACGNSRVTITGYVEDLNYEIARSALYVAPLVSGGGFKNKVMEAIVNRTFVAGTSLAVEFLDPATRELILIANTADGLADAIVEFLRCPQAFQPRLEALYQHVQKTFSWSSRTDQLLEIIGNSVMKSASTASLDRSVETIET